MIIPLFIGFHTSQVVQDFFHQQYHLDFASTHPVNHPRLRPEICSPRHGETSREAWQKVKVVPRRLETTSRYGQLRGQEGSSLNGIICINIYIYKLQATKIEDIPHTHTRLQYFFYLKLRWEILVGKSFQIEE